MNGTGGNEFQRFDPKAHFTFLLAGNRVAAPASDADRAASAVLRVMCGVSCALPVY